MKLITKEETKTQENKKRRKKSTEKEMKKRLLWFGDADFNCYATSSREGSIKILTNFFLT